MIQVQHVHRQAGTTSKTQLMLLLSLLVGVLAFTVARASVPTPSVQPYQQDFDSLIASGSATWQNDSTLKGWYASAGSTSITSIDAYNSATVYPNNDRVYSFGPTNGSDRAIGVIGSSSNAPKRIGFVFKNTSGSRIKRLQVTYTGEQWIDGNTDQTPELLQFKYKKGTSGVALGATDVQSSQGYTRYSALDFVSPKNAGTGPIDGNDAANQAVVSAQIELRPDLGPNQEMLFVWEKDNASGNDDGLAIDNLSITAGFGVALPVASCPAVLTTFTGSPVSGQVSAFDPNGTVVQAQIVSAVSGVTLTNQQPASAPGGTFTASLQADGTQAVGNYPIVLQFTSQEANETKRCTTTLNVRSTTDLAIAKDGPASYKPGEQITYVLTVNPGGTIANGVTVIDTLPSDVSYVSDNSGVTPTFNGQTITWNLGDVPAQKVIALVVQVSANASGSITNTVTASTTSQDTNTTNNTASVSTPQYVPTANFASSSKTVSATTVQVGDTFTYVLAVNNDGDADGSYTLTDTLPESLTLVSAPGLAQQGQQLSATGVISGGDQLQYSVSVKANAVGSVANVATLTGGGIERSLVAPVVTVVAQATPPNFSTSGITVDKTRGSRGEQVVYTITVVNSGQQSGTYTLSDQLDVNLELVNAPGLVLNGRNLTATGTLGAGLSRTYTVVVKIAPNASLGAAIANAATLGGDGQTRILQAPLVTVVQGPLYIPIVKK